MTIAKPRGPLTCRSSLNIQLKYVATIHIKYTATYVPSHVSIVNVDAIITSSLICSKVPAKYIIVTKYDLTTL